LEAGGVELMSGVHRIRLRGHWRVCALRHRAPGDDRRSDDSNSTPKKRTAPATVKIESDWSGWLGEDFCGVVQLRRRFNCPTGLAPGQKVYLVIELAKDKTKTWHRLSLNKRPLAFTTVGGEAHRAEISDLLMSNNEIEIEIRINSGVARESQRAAGDDQRPLVYLEIEYHE
jgi:hypothetical protein